MSYRFGQYSEYPKHHPHDHGRPPDRRPSQSRSATSPTRDGRSSYTLVHAGKQVRFGPVVFWIVVGTVTLLGLWSAATATYFAFRDDVLTRLMTRQAKMQDAYEDRIAELRARIDRTTSHQLLDSEQLDQKLRQIMHRQAELKSRAAALRSVIPDITGSIKPSSRARAGSRAMGRAKPSPVGDTVIFAAPPNHQARLQSGVPIAVNPPPQELAERGGIQKTLLRLDHSLDRLQRRQMAALGSYDDKVEWRLRRMRGVISDLGLSVAHLEAATPRASAGGPFVPFKVPANAGPFERELYRVDVARAQMDWLKRTLAYVPYRKPVVGKVAVNSGFGVRIDPFNDRPAMHPGIDIHAEVGDPVLATADGKVVKAGWFGGYGRMVEINHGNGLSTRYGHLSKLRVRVGESVKIGQVIGEVGSTGRSTGPHLHYETRIDGEAVNPEKFLHAGAQLTGIRMVRRS
ncbi:MAG: M23 family metallopeptidase [Bradyrhizobium sp.]